MAKKPTEKNPASKKKLSNRINESLIKFEMSRRIHQWDELMKFLDFGSTLPDVSSSQQALGSLMQNYICIQPSECTRFMQQMYSVALKINPCFGTWKRDKKLCNKIT
jgi:hypothetical protein